MLLLADDTKHLTDIVKLDICKRNIKNRKLVHFAYRIDDIIKEVKKRTNYIGANRADQNGNLLVDRMTYSNDEFDLNRPLTKDAMAQVFIPLLEFTQSLAESYLYDEEDFKSYNKVVDRGYKFTTKFTFDNADNSVEIALRSNKQIAPEHYVEASVELEYKVEDVIGDIYKKRTTAVERIDMSNASMRTEEIDGKTVYTYTKKFIPDYEADFEDNGIGAERVFDVIVVSVKTKTQDVHPHRINAGDWLELKYDEDLTELYVAHTNCTSNNKFGCPYYYEFMPFDFRKTIHYILFMPFANSTAALKALDTHIENAIITYCIYRWFLLVRPEEAQIWYEEFLKRMEMIKELLSSQQGVIMERPLWYC